MKRSSAAALFVCVVAGFALLSRFGASAPPPPALSAIPAETGPPHPRRVTALGRIQPKDGIRKIAGPSQDSVVIAELLVDKGDPVEAGQVVAVLDTHDGLAAAARRLEVELKSARRELDRHDRLFRDHIESDSAREDWATKTQVLEADLARAKAELERTSVRSPIRGRVVEVHTRAGERVRDDGIVGIASNEMYAVAEVYESDVSRVRLGQRASVSSSALAEPLSGTVDRIGQTIGKSDALGSDPLARIDSRVVEVEVRLDDPEKVSGLTNLQVEISIGPSGA